MAEIKSFGPYAEEYARIGLPVIMVKRKAKEAAQMDWVNIATTDPAVAHEWWKGNNRLFNIGIVMGDRAGIIDIETDNHGGPDGEDSLKAYMEKAGTDLPDTWMFKSGSGGIHRLFRCETPVSSGVGILPGVDVRGNGGYAVVPPSIHPNGNFYEWVEGMNPTALPDGPADLPACLLNLLTVKKEDGTPFELPDKIAKGERDTTLFKMAASLRAQEYTEDEILATLNAVNDRRCDPPLTGKQLEKIAKSVGKYERGSSARSKRLKVPELDIQSARDLQEEQLPPIRWIVADLIPQGLTLLASPPKYGKSWWVLDLCLSVAAGDRFMNRYTEKTGCLYLALEDSKNRLQSRINRLTYNAPAPIGFNYSLTAENIDNGLITQLEKYLKDYPQTGLIVIDTLQKIKGEKGKNESAYADDYRQMGLLKRLADDHSICVLLVHHLKKGRTDGDAFESISGTNAIFGSADTALVMRKERRTDKETILHVTGRDVTADDTVIEFNRDSCRWESKGSVDEIEARRLTLEYENDPVVRTVKALLEQAPIWKGTASELYSACLEITGVPPAEDAKALGKKIRATADMLYLRDNVLYLPPGKNGGASGRKHTFQKNIK